MYIHTCKTTFIKIKLAEYAVPDSIRIKIVSGSCNRHAFFDAHTTGGLTMKTMPAQYAQKNKIET